MTTGRGKFPPEFLSEIEEKREKEKIYEALHEVLREWSKRSKLTEHYSDFLKLSSSKFDKPSWLKERIPSGEEYRLFFYLPSVERKELERSFQPEILRSVVNELRVLRTELQELKAERRFRSPIEKVWVSKGERIEKGNPEGKTKTGFFTVPDFSFMLGSLIGGFGLICTGIITDVSYYSVMGAILIFATFLHLMWLLKE